MLCREHLNFQMVDLSKVSSKPFGTSMEKDLSLGKSFSNEKNPYRICEIIASKPFGSSKKRETA